MHVNILLTLSTLFAIAVDAKSSLTLTTSSASSTAPKLAGLCVANASNIVQNKLSTSPSSSNLGINISIPFTSYMPSSAAKTIKIVHSGSSKSPAITGFILYGSMPTANHVGSFSPSSGQTTDASCLHRLNVADDNNSTLITTSVPSASVLQKGLSITWTPPDAYGDGNVVFTGAFFASDGSYQIVTASPIIEGDTINSASQSINIVSTSVPTQSQGIKGNGGALPTGISSFSANGTTNGTSATSGAVSLAASMYLLALLPILYSL